MCVVTSRLMYIFSLADRCTAMPVIRHIIRKNSGFHIGILKCYYNFLLLYSDILSRILRVYQVNNGIVLDFRLVLSDIGRYCRGSRVVHVLQRLECNGLSRNTCTVTVSGFKADILLYRVGTGILHEITECRFRNIEAFHTVIVKYRKLDLDEPVADKDTGYGSPDTLLSETCYRSIEVSSLFQLCIAYRHIVQKLESQTCAFMRLL